MRNPELKKKKKAKDSITSLANQCDNMCEVIESLADKVRNDIGGLEMAREQISSLDSFVTLSDRLCEDLEMYANILDGYSKEI